ncbi:MAG: helix-turn-helix domain-containing protein [Streptosporangiaceae bacterium]
MSHPIAQPLRPLTEAERAELLRIRQAPTESCRRHQRAIALLAVAAGQPLTQAAHLAGWRVHDTVTRLVRHFNASGLAALDDQPRSGRPRRYGPAERARIVAELRRAPDRHTDGTATWSLSTLQRALRSAPDGLSQVSTFTILYTVHDAGFTWQKTRTWCETGTSLRRGKYGTVKHSDPYTLQKQAMIERAYRLGESLGMQVWCEDEAGPYQAIPQAGSSWQRQGQPIRQAHQYERGGTMKLLTLFRPATGELRAEAVDRAPNAILHPWLKAELGAIMQQCEPAPGAASTGRRWADWDIYPGAEHLDRFFPPVRVLLILDNLAGHQSHSLVQWCAEQGILLLLTPCAGSWLNMAESVQRIIRRRAVEGHHPENTEILKVWFRETVQGWNRHPTPFLWGGKRHARRDRAYARRHRQGGSGAVTLRPVPRRIRSIRYAEKRLVNAA